MAVSASELIGGVERVHGKRYSHGVRPGFDASTVAGQIEEDGRFGIRRFGQGIEGAADASGGGFCISSNWTLSG